MRIRNYQAGDDAVQAEIYNEAACGLPKFKPAAAVEVARRRQAEAFDPNLRFYAEEGGQVHGYAVCNANGRLSYPWCRPGTEAVAGPLFARVLEEARKRHMSKVFAAYRTDWPVQQQFFVDHGFAYARDMVNFVADAGALREPRSQPTVKLEQLKHEDIAVALKLTPATIAVTSVPALARCWLDNPFLGSSSLFAARDLDGRLRAVVAFVRNPSFADPHAVDANMPCFRLGAFGTEGMHVKRINGLFSFVAQDDEDLAPLALGMLHQLRARGHTSPTAAIAAQVASDAMPLLRFYEGHFQRQGSFPVFERTL